MGLTSDATLNEILGTSSTSDDTGTAAAAAAGATDTTASTDQGHKEEGSSSEGALNTDDQGGDKAAGDKAEEGEGKGKDEGGDKQPYHKDPLNQRLLKERDKAREEAAYYKGLAEGTAAKGGATKTDPNSPEALGYVDISTKTEEEITEWQTRDPKGYAANLLAQAKAEVYNEIKADTGKEAQERSREEVRKAYEKYTEKNPDFKDMWEDGKIQEYMRTHPGHTAMSAHMEMTEDARFQRAVKAKEKEIEKNVIAKRRAGGGLGVGGGGPRKGFTAVEDPALKNTKAGGGLVSTLANKLRLSRMNTT